MMPIRSDISDFPFACRTKETWFVLVNWSIQEISDYYNVSGKRDLVIKLNQITTNNEESSYRLFGIWHGNYSTDLFEIPIEIAKDQLGLHFS